MNYVWEQRKLESLCDVFTDGDWIEAKDQSDSGIRLVQTGNVGTTEYLDKENNKKWISEETFERLHCEEIYEGDILISRLPEPAGRACIMPDLGVRMITAVDCTIVRTSKEYDSKYLVQYLSTPMYFKIVNSFLGGGTRQRISRGNLSGIDIPIPSTIEEQWEIGEFFSNLDHLITLHQRKICIFIKKMPIDWEQRKLGEVFEFQYGEFNNNPDNGGEYPIYGANGIIGGYTDWNAENSSIIGHMGAYAGYVVWGEGKHFVTYNGTIARPKDNSIDSKYGYYLLDSKKIYKICAGSGQPFVSYSDLNGIDILLPKDKDEQRLLAYYFTNLDHLITLHHRE